MGTEDGKRAIIAGSALPILNMYLDRNLKRAVPVSGSNGALLVSDPGLEIARGNVPDILFIHKFGNAPDFDTGDGKVTVWDGAEDGTDWENMQYDYSSGADIDSVSSSDDTDNQMIEIQGLDLYWNMIVQIVQLNGQTRVPLQTNLIRVFRIKNIDSVNLSGHVFCYENVALVAGIPSDASKIRAIVQPGDNQTLMAVFSIPYGYTGYMKGFFATLAGASKSTACEIDLLARPYNGVFQIKHRSSIIDTGTSHFQHMYSVPEIFYEKTDIEMRADCKETGVIEASISAGFDIILVKN